MIVKMWNPLNKGWTYLDGVKSIDVKTNYCPHIFKETDSAYKQGWNELEFVLIIKDKDSENGIVKNTSCMCHVDHILIDPEWNYNDNSSSEGMLTKGQWSKYEYEEIYSCKILLITFENEKKETYALTSNKVYLLNNEGKTIEHI